MASRGHLERQICVLLAGRAAEQAVFGAENLTAGAASDIARATEIASGMVSELGMAGEPAVSLAALNRALGGVTGAAEQARSLLSELYRRTLALIESEIGALSTLADALLESEALEGLTAEAILDAALSSERPESA